MSDFLESIADNRIVLVASGDDIGMSQQPSVQAGLRALESLGSKQIRKFSFRDSWAMVAVKGYTNALAEGFQSGYGLTLEWRFGPPRYAATIYQTIPAVRLQWHSVPGKKYHVESSPDLITWTTVTQQLLGTGVLMSYYQGFLDQATVRTTFYRLVQSSGDES